jgi:hypothetical protein
MPPFVCRSLNLEQKREIEKKPNVRIPVKMISHLKKNELTKTFCYTDGKAGINSKDTIRMFRIKTSTLM